jgi:hypothetical protein
MALGLGACGAAWRCRADRARRLVSCALLALWGCANLLWQWDALHLLPLADFAVALLALLIWTENPKPWAALVLALAYFRLALHAGNEVSGGTFLVGYIHALNALYALQLVVVSFSGGANECRGVLCLFLDRHLFRPSRTACFEAKP